MIEERIGGSREEKDGERKRRTERGKEGTGEERKVKGKEGWRRESGTKRRKARHVHGAEAYAPLFFSF